MEGLSAATEAACRLLMMLPPHGPTGAAHGITGYFLEVALDRGCGLALSDTGWLFIELAATYFRQDPGLFTGALEPPHGYIEGFIFSYFYCRHLGPRLLSIFRRKHPKKNNEVRVPPLLQNGWRSVCLVFRYFWETGVRIVVTERVDCKAKCEGMPWYSRLCLAAKSIGNQELLISRGGCNKDQVLTSLYMHQRSWAKPC